MVYLPIDRHTQLDRIQDRWTRTPHRTFPITLADADRWRGQFEAPDASELGDLTPGDPPPGWVSWRAWAEDRWPTSLGD